MPGAPADWDVTEATASMEEWPAHVASDPETLTLTPTGPDYIVAVHQTTHAVVSGDSYRLSATILAESNSLMTSAVECSVRAHWYTAEDEYLSTAPLTREPDYWGSLTDYITADITAVYTAPPGAAFLRLGLEFRQDETDVDAYGIDTISVESAPRQFEIDADDALGMVTVTVGHVPDDVHSDATVSVWRVHSDGSQHPIRGYDGDMVRQPYAEGTMIFEDYEAPLGETISYRVQWWWGPDTWYEELTTRPVKAPKLPSGDFVWVKSPSLPALNTVVMMAEPVAWSRSSRSSVYEIVGRKHPVAVTEVRGTRTGTLNIFTWDFRVHEAFNALHDNGLPVLVQAMPGHGLPANLYLSVGDISAEPISGSATEPGWLWTLEVQEIDRTPGGLQGSAGRTWADVEELPDWAEVYDMYRSWLDVLTGTEVG